MTAEQLRKTAGGVVGQFTPKEIEIDLAGASTGDVTTGLKVPAGKMIVACYLKNLADDLTSSGSATLQIKIGSSAIGSAVAKANLKGTCAYIPIIDYNATDKDSVPSAVVTSAETDVKVTVGTAGITTGNITVGCIYL